MQQIAIFIDAEWLLSEAAPLFGGQQPEPDHGAAVTALRARVRAAVPGARLLRVYWYDAAADDSIGRAHDLKLRKLGLASDLAELARNHAISDALILAGDDALADAIALAQAFGVRVHLAGVAEAHVLATEADTYAVWGRGDLAWLAARPSATSAADFERILEDRLDREIESLSDEDIDSILAYAEFSNGRVPQVHDRPMLSRLGAAAGRTLTEKERETFRKRLIAELRLELEPVGEDEDEVAGG